MDSPGALMRSFCRKQYLNKIMYYTMIYENSEVVLSAYCCPLCADTAVHGLAVDLLFDNYPSFLE